jgi:hypothetical protein
VTACQGSLVGALAAVRGEWGAAAGSMVVVIVCSLLAALWERTE